MGGDLVPTRPREKFSAWKDIFYAKIFSDILICQKYPHQNVGHQHFNQKEG